MPFDSLHFFLGARFLVQHSAIDRSCFNRMIEDSKLPFFVSHISEISPCISVAQLNILDVAVHRHLLVMIFLHEPFPSYCFATFVIRALYQQT
jgi:hypothetical protein